MIEVVAPAKVNLTLHVTGRRPDGYHLLDSLVVFADKICDVIKVAPSDELVLHVDGPFADGVPTDETNLVLRAAQALNPGGCAEIHLTKNLPHGAGIGGGSADAAATLKALTQLWDVPLPDDKGLSLGADVPVCLAGPEPQFMSGIGEKIGAAPPLPPLWLVLVNPQIVLPTGEVFAMWHDMFDDYAPCMDELPNSPDADAFLTWLAGCHNHLTPAAMQIAPEIGAVIDALWSHDACEDADMSGSGSTCRGVFEMKDAARSAATQLQRDHPDWWVAVSSIALALS